MFRVAAIARLRNWSKLAGMYAVTGATGAFGTLAVHHLIKLGVPAASIVAIARNDAKTATLRELGVTIRIADYDDRAAFDAALNGVDRLLLVSASRPGKRFAQHSTVIDAAKQAGVKRLVYTSISHADVSQNPLAGEHKATEAYLTSSGIPTQLMRNNWYHENYVQDVKQAKATGVIAAAITHGRVASASRSDYAEAAVRVLIGDSGEAKTYELTGATAWTFPELAAVASDVVGRSVAFVTQTSAERKQTFVSVGMPEAVADFILSLDLATEAGTLAQVHGDLAQLLGRAPQSLHDGLRDALAH